MIAHINAPSRRQAQGPCQAQKFVAENNDDGPQHRPRKSSDAAHFHHGDGQQKGLDRQCRRGNIPQIVNVEAAGNAGQKRNQGKDLEFFFVFIDPQGRGEILWNPLRRQKPAPSRNG